MNFLDTGEKIKKLRKELNIKQEELNAVGVSRNFISMIENGKRKLPQHVAFKLMGIFRDKADKLGVKLDVDEHWLMISAKEQAIEFCNEKLKNDLTPGDIDTIATLVKNYEIKELVPTVYLFKANKLYDERLYEEAFTYYYEMLEYSDKKDSKAFLYNKLGKCKTMMLNYVEAIVYFNKCYEYSLLDNECNNQRNCLYNMALCYRKLESAELALDCVNGFLKLCKIENNFDEYMGAIILKANCFADQHKYTEAINTLIRNVKKFNSKEHILLGYIYNGLGSLYLDIGKLDNAMIYLDKAYNIRLLKDKYNLPRTILNKAEVFIKKDNLEKALQLINKAAVLAEGNQDYEFVIRCYRELEKLYNDKEDVKKLYIKMIELFNKISNKQDLLKVYVKLLKILSETKCINEYEVYLNDAFRLVELYFK